jgi:hypothetical protein
MRTSRRVLKLIHHMIHVLALPGSEAMSLILGTYRGKTRLPLSPTPVYTQPHPAKDPSHRGLLEP